MIELKHENANVWARKGITFDLLKNTGQKTACFNKAIELDPTDSYEWMFKGYEFLKHGDDDHAAFASITSHWYAQGKRDFSFPRAAAYDDAIKCFDKAFKSDPGNTLAEEMKNLTLSKQKNGW